MTETTVILSRVQFGMTSIFHFLIVPATIGLLTFIVITETVYAVSKKEKYLTLTKYFGKIYLYFYAVGIVTGIIQEFQFGMNWSEYSKFVGDVFGVPLAIEALLAFFLESTFLGLWMFTWDRVSPKLHCFFLWLIYLGSLFSAVFILMANAFMQAPVGFEVTDGVAKLTDFQALLHNPQFLMEAPHVVLACLITGGLLVAGISVWQSRKQPELKKLFHPAINIGLVLTLVASIVTIYFGDMQGKLIVKDQPMKFSAIEAIWEDTEDPAPWNFIADIDVANKTNPRSIEIPEAGSKLAYGKPEGALKGMNTLNKEYAKKYGEGDYIPPVKTLFWFFRIMVFGGIALILVALLGLIFNNLPKKGLSERPLIGGIVKLSILIPFLLSTSGWLITEVGRYPFTVYGLFKMSDSVSPNLTTGSAFVSVLLLFVTYATIGGVLIWLIVKQANRASLSLANGTEKESSTQDLFGKENF